MELAHPMGLVVVGGLTLAMALGCPCGATDGSDRQRLELVEGEAPV